MCVCVCAVQRSDGCLQAGSRLLVLGGEEPPRALRGDNGAMMTVRRIMMTRMMIMMVEGGGTLRAVGLQCVERGGQVEKGGDQRTLALLCAQWASPGEHKSLKTAPAFY